MIFSRRLRSQEHVRAFVVDEADERGWEVREEEDHHVVKRTWMHDWHRVENAMMRFRARGDPQRFSARGWVEVSHSNHRLNGHAGRQRFGDRRLVRDLQQLCLLLAIDRFAHRNLPFDAHRLFALLDRGAALTSIVPSFHCLRSLYIRSVIAVHAPRLPSIRSKGAGPVFVPPRRSGSSDASSCPDVVVIRLRVAASRRSPSRFARIIVAIGALLLS